VQNQNRIGRNEKFHKAQKNKPIGNMNPIVATNKNLKA
jgi:hypothetical protein